MTRWARPITAMLLISFAAALGARAQGLLGLGGVRTGDPVTIRALVNKSPITPGSDAQVAVAVTVRTGYHIQSAFAPKPYIAASFSKLTVPPGITLGEIRYPKPKNVPAPGGDGDLSVYDGKVYFLIPLHVAAAMLLSRRTNYLPLPDHPSLR